MKTTNSQTNSSMNQKVTRSYYLINPEVYKNLQTRLKYTTPPALSQLVDTDQSIDELLQDSNVSTREKQRILSEKLQELHTLKDIVQSKEKPTAQVEVAGD